MLLFCAGKAKLDSRIDEPHCLVLYVSASIRTAGPSTASPRGSNRSLESDPLLANEVG